ncbi:non-ribosomal peptide synthetase, partial [Pseudoalteromonas luteoviolacea]|uniref:condensation domain-containing protein n=1 Tax=Pseudoalteromonas luteoviolacea TaxID=43657 RepID=UPI001B418BF1
EFLGRVDEQVKIRGFRVELGEIEKQLTQLPDIDAAVVQIQKDQYGQAHLVAYIQQNSTTCESDIRAALCQQLPDYMLPSHFVVLQTWPLTANGKLDKKALPKVDFELRSGASISPPKTPLEQDLVNAWTNVLGREADTIGIDDNFFSLGGHSLLSVKLLDAIRQFSQVNLSVKDIFKYPTIRELANYIAQIDDSPCGQSINKIQRSALGHALSYAQQRLWFIDSVQGATSEYNMPFAFRLTGNVDPTYIERAFQHILQRHEVLRSVYREVDGTIRQHPLDNMTFNLSRHDLSHLSGDKQTHALKQLMVQDASTSFSLQDDLMLRATYVHLDKTPQATQAALLVNMHHIASDGWSVSVLMKEFLTLYNAQLKVATPIHDLDDVLPELTIQYIDFAHWQRNWLSNGVLDEQLAYWKTQLADLPALHSLPLDMPRPVVKQTKAQGITGHLPAHVSASLCQLAEHFQLTPFMLLHAALAQVIAHYSHNEDVTVGTVVANRGLPQTNDLVGFFVNTLVLRVSASPTQPLSSYLHHVKQVHTQAQINQDVPFEQLVDSLQPERNTAFSPLFQIALSSNSGLGELFDVIDEGQSNDMQISTLLNDERSLKFDLEINVHMNKSGGVLSWVYDSALFNKVSIDRLNNHLCHYLSEWSKLVDGEHVIDKPLNELTMLSQAEQHHALSVLNGPIRDYP